jgi:hypothetical protein
MQVEYEDDPQYQQGYSDGQKAKRSYARENATKFGVKMGEIRAINSTF